METVYQIFTENQAQQFIDLYPNIHWASGSALTLESITRGGSCPLAIYVDGNSRLTCSSIEYSTQQLMQYPYQYRLVTLSPFLDVSTVFTTFLKHEGKYDDYLYYYDNEYESLSAYRLLTAAFQWGYTEDGFYYWDQINVRWHKLLKHFNIPKDTVLHNVRTSLSKGHS